MREIKFRGRGLDGTWYYGWLAHDSCIADARGGHAVLSGTVGQFTGLRDKTGMKIYEGDIVRLKFRDGLSKFSYELGVIKWHERSSAFKWFSIDEDPSDANNYWLLEADNSWREVIGNIYENPNLLKGGEHEELPTQAA